MVDSFWFPIGLSLLVSSLATSLAFVSAVLCAYFSPWVGSRVRSFLETIFLLPLVLPPSVIGFLLLYIFGLKSPIGQVLKEWTGQMIIFTPVAAVMAAVVVAFPLMYQSAKTGFQQLDNDILGAARVDGADEKHLFFHIAIPLAKKALIMGIVLSFTRSLGEFGATLMFAGNIPGKTQTISTAIYVALETGNDSVAWGYVGISVGFSFLLLWLIRKAT